MGIEGNERADEMAKMGAAKEGRDHITEGGLRQWEKAKRLENRVRVGHLDATKWDRHNASMCTQLSTEAWTYKIAKTLQQQQHVKDERLVYLDNQGLPHVAEN